MTLVVYWPALGNDFVLWDDNIDIYENIHIRSMGSDFFLWALSTQGKHLWEPVTWITYALDHALWDLRPAGYHLTSVLLHAVNTFLAFFLVIKLLEAGGGAAGRTTLSSRSGRGLLITAGAAAALFGLHPLQVESTAWVSARPALLQALFSMLSIMSYLEYASASSDAERTASGPPAPRKPYLLSLGYFVLACGSKASAVVLPFILLTLDWFPLNRLRKLKRTFPLFSEKIPFIAAGIVLSFVTYSAQKAMGTMDTLMESSAALRALAAVKATVLYLVKIAAPFGLSPFYPFPETASPAFFEYLSVLLLAGITAGSLLLIRKLPAVPAAFLIFLTALAPSIGLVKVREVFMADRYVYLASLGAFCLAGLMAAGIWRWADTLRSWTVKGSLIALAVCMIISLSYLTRKQIAVWRNTITLWSAVIEKEPRRVPIAYLNRGLAYESNGNHAQAVEDFSRAISIDPSPRYTYLAYNNRGTTLSEMGRVEEGLQDLNHAISMEPASFLAYTNRGLVLGKMGLYDRAIEDFSRAIALNPASVDPYVGRGVAFEKTDRPERAIPDLDKAIELDPYNANAYMNRGVSLERTGKLERALSDYDKAVFLDPADPLAYANRGRVWRALGETGKAVEDLSRAIDQDPDFGPAYAERAGLYQRSGKEDLAKKDLERACRLEQAAACDLLQDSARTRSVR